MKAKRLISFSIATIFLCSSLCGCGDDGKSESNINEGSQNSFANENNAMETPDNSESDGGGDSISTEPTTEPPEISIEEAGKFSSGLAWVKSEYYWNLIDTRGNIVKQFDPELKIVSNFVNGYSIIAPSDDTELAYAQIIDRDGNIVFDISENGYKKIINYSGLGDGSIILEKNIDTFEKSGDFLYHLNLNTEEITELNFFDNEDDELKYVHNGIYIVYGWRGYGGNTLVMYDLINNKEVIFSDADSVISGLDGEPERWVIHNAEGLFFATIETKNHDCAIVSVDFENHTYYKTSIEFEYGIDDIWYNVDDCGIYNTAVYICDDTLYHNDKGLYDFETHKFVDYAPKTEYTCDFVDYSNEYFLVTTENKNDTVFYTIIDWDMNPLFTPKRYNDTTTLFDDYLISVEDDGSVSITRISSMSTIKNISNSTIVYVDETNKCVWINNKQETTECYNIETGELLFSLSGIYNVYSDFNDGLSLVGKSTTGELMYVDVNGDRLKIVDNSI